MLAKVFPAGYKVKVSRKSKRKIDVSEVFSLYTQGYDDQAVEKQLEIVNKALRTAQSAIIALNPQAAAILFGGPQDDYRVLVDENLPPRMIMGLYRTMGLATHTRYTALCGQNDYVVYDYTVHNGMDMILTRDKHETKSRDLTVIAMAAAAEWLQPARMGSLQSILPPPLLVRLERRKDADGAITRHAPLIKSLIDQPYTP